MVKFSQMIIASILISNILFSIAKIEEKDEISFLAEREENSLGTTNYDMYNFAIQWLSNIKI